MDKNTKDILDALDFIKERLVTKDDVRDIIKEEVPRIMRAMIVEVVPGSPADQAGLRGGQRQVRIGGTILLVGGDILTAIDGKAIANDQDLTQFLDTKTQVGQICQRHTRVRSTLQTWLG